MSIIITVAAFALALGLLIVVHEYGHFRVARLFDVKVLCFSVGFGRSLWSRRVGADGMELRIAVFPLGGYVKMLDEREDQVAPHELHRAFNRKPVWQRFAIVAAGPLANFVAALVLYWVLFLHGVPGVLPVIASPAPGSAAALAGFKAGDTLLKAGTQDVRSWQDFRWIMLQRGLERGNLVMEVKDQQGALVRRDLNLGQISGKDLEGDILGVVGFSRMRLPVKAQLGELTSGGAAARAGLRSGDLVTAINGERIGEWEALVQKVRAAPGQALKFQVTRDGVEMAALTVRPDPVRQGDAEFGRIGASPRLDPQILQQMSVNVSYGPVEALLHAATKTWDTAIFSLRMLGRMLTGDVSLKNLSGPITIADYAGQSAQSGWISYLLFLALISISLGVLNLLPVPLLDGGHLMYYSVEFLTGRPVSDRVMELGQHAGMAVLFVLMMFALFNDVNRLFGN